MFDPLTRIPRLEAFARSLRENRSSFDTHWRDLGDYFHPRRMRFTANDRNRGDKRNQNIINSTARFAARTLQSGLHAGLTSPARPWMKLTTPDPDLSEFEPVREWLHSVTTRMLSIFAVSNIYNTLPIVYGDLGVFATGAMALLPDENDLFRAVAYPIGSYYLGQDSRGKTCTFMRDYQLTARQIVELYGNVRRGSSAIDWSQISMHVRQAWDRGDYELGVDVTWCVLPNENYNPASALSKHKKYASLIWETGGAGTPGGRRVFLSEMGFDTFPVMAPRWDITGEDTYGTSCPGMDVLGDNRQLQIMERKKGQGLAKMVDPPLQAPASMRVQKTSSLPGEISYVEDRAGGQGIRALYDVNLNMQHLSMELDRVEARINRGFFVDLFLMLAASDNQRGAQPMTAREVDERHEEKLIALGPVLERTNDELLDPIVDRTFDMMAEHALLPPPPPELQGVKLKVEYISILSQAQKLVGVAGQDRFLTSAVNLAPVFPEVRAMVDVKQGMRNYADMLGVDPRIVRTIEEADAIIKAEQDAQAAAQEAQQAEQMAGAMKSASEAKLQGGGSALDRVLENAGAGAQPAMAGAPM